MKVNYRAISRKFEAELSPTLRKSLALVAKKTAHWGIKDQGDLALIMGVLNFGDPAHTVPNTKKDSPRRKAIEDAIAVFGGNDSEIPKRPWLSQSTEGVYRYTIRRYIEANLGKLVAGLKKKGKAGSYSSQRALSADDFLKGLAEVGCDNAQDNWENGTFAPNKPMTVHNKGHSKPLHGKGTMKLDSITGWVS